MPSYLITGASKGIGLEFVSQLVSSPSNLTRTRTSKLFSLVNDILSPSSTSKPQLTYLLNSAGINAARLTASTLSHSPSELDTHIHVNVLPASSTISALDPLLGEDSVVMNLSSGVGSVARMLKDKFGVGAAYAVSKAALNMASVMVANQYESEGRGVRVVVVDPGHVRTDMGGAHAPLEPRESVEGMLRLLHGLGEGDTGRFYLYDGSEVPW